MAIPTIAGSYMPYIPILLTTYFLVSYVAAWSRLRQFKGPWLCHFSYLWQMRTSTSGRANEILTEVSRKYGPLARIGPNDLLTDDVELVKRMNGARSTYRRSTWYDAMRMDPWADGMFSIRDTAAHDKLKAQVAAGYGGKENPNLEDGIDEQIVGLRNLIRRKYISKGGAVRPMDFGRVAQYFTLDAITRVAYGHAFGYLETDSDVHGYIHTTEQYVPFLQLSGDTPWIHKIVGNPYVMMLTGPQPTDKTGIGKILGVAQEVVSKRFGPDAKDSSDMLGAFIRHGLSKQQCETEVMFQIIAGSDTTATAIRATMLYTMTTPYIYQKLRAEVDDAIRNGKISNPIKSDEGKRMDYLQAVIYEGLRIHPPFTGLISKEVPPEGDNVLGQYLPPGTRIAQSTWNIMRHKSIFGEDVEVFRPERWTEATSQERADMQRTTELGFGSGRWGCAGKPVAFMELNKIFVELLRDFDFQLINPTKPWTSANHQLFMQSEMWVKVTERAEG